MTSSADSRRFTTDLLGILIVMLIFTDSFALWYLTCPCSVTCVAPMHLLASALMQHYHQAIRATTSRCSSLPTLSLVRWVLSQLSSVGEQATSGIAMNAFA